MDRGTPKNAFHRPFATLAKVKKAMAQEAPGKRGGKPQPSVAPPREPPERDDASLFLSEVAGARPLATGTNRVGAPDPTTQTHTSRPDDAEVLAELADMCRGEGAFDIADSDEFIEGIAEGIDRRLLRRLRAGEYAVQAHVDLHGQTREAARASVSQFLAASRRAGHRCVLMVHGRGLHSRDQIPVLKEALRTWLQRGQIARSVLAFATARPCDGGAGAVYVLLRRLR